MKESSQGSIKFLDYLQRLVSDGTKFKITISKQRPGNTDIINVYIKPAMIKGELNYSFTYRYQNKDQVNNFNKYEIDSEIKGLIENAFYNAVIFTEDEETQLLQNKKGKSTTFTKKLKTSLTIEEEHDHQKSRFIPEDREYLHLLGLTSKDGNVYDKSQKKYRQINKYIEIIDSLTKNYSKDKMIRVADMGSGKGYLTFALYDYFENIRNIRCRMIGYELREDLVTKCYSAALKSGFAGLSFQQKSIDEAQVKDTEMVIALHACDIATDMAIAKGIQAGAEFIIVSPCCHKQVRKSMNYKNDLSPILQHGIMEERQAEMITDGIRALLMEAHGYKTQIIEFISSEHTGKNLMITGIKAKPNPNALEEVDKIKKVFGVEYHYLEKLLID
jgi:hypothetical protein